MQSFLVSVVAVLSAFSHHVIMTGVPLMKFYPFGSTAGDTGTMAQFHASSMADNLQ